MTENSLWTTALEAFEAIGAHYGSAMVQAAAGFGLFDWYGWLLPALWFEPEPISATLLRRRYPYSSTRLISERLANATGQGFLAPAGDEENDYRLTELGRQAAERVVAAMYAKMEMLQPISSPDLERLANLLQRLVISCLAAPEPPGKWHLLRSRRTDRGLNASVIVQIDQYGGDLAAYRDDAHLAAWQPHNVEGHAWEAFTYLWREKASSFDQLYHELERRGYSREEYRQALAGLVQRGWIHEEAGHYQVSVPGGEVRQAAEEITDRYFYAPWSCLSQRETEELRELLIILCDGLRLWLD